MLIGWLLLGLAAQRGGSAAEPPAPEARRQPGADGALANLSLEQCLDLALANNQRRPISRAALEVAEAQHQQALSSYWPQLILKGSYTVLDDAPTFLFPGKTMTVPAQNVTLPPNALGPGFPPQSVNMQVPASSYQVPDQKVKLMDRELGEGSLCLTYPLYTGGQRGAIVDQARAGVRAASEEVRRTDLEIAYDVKRMYYGAVMSRELLAIGRETCAQMEGTLRLTEQLYKNGSGKVLKTDFLRNKVVLDGIRSAVALLESNAKISLAALSNTMGLDWNTTLTLAGAGIPNAAPGGKLEDLVGATYEFNPDWGKINAALDAAGARVREARSNHYPKVGFFGSLRRLFNASDSGMMTEENKSGWAVGIGFELPLFSGFRTQNEVREARARLEQVRHQKILLQDALALEVKMYFLQLEGAWRSSLALEQAAANAEENRKLFIRAYQNEMAETKDVIESQMMEALMKAQRQKALFDHVQNEAQLEFVVGREVKDRLHL